METHHSTVPNPGKGKLSSPVWDCHQDIRRHRNPTGVLEAAAFIAYQNQFFAADALGLWPWMYCYVPRTFVDEPMSWVSEYSSGSRMSYDTDLGSLEDLSHTHAQSRPDWCTRTGHQHPDMMSPSHPNRLDTTLPSRDHFLCRVKRHSSESLKISSVETHHSTESREGKTVESCAGDVSCGHRRD